jgi:hypothetical protein
VRFRDCAQFAIPEGASLDAAPAALGAWAEGMGGPGPGNPHEYKVDCLSMNIWTKPQVGEKAKGTPQKRYQQILSLY